MTNIRRGIGPPGLSNLEDSSSFSVFLRLFPSFFNAPDISVLSASICYNVNSMCSEV